MSKNVYLNKYAAVYFFINFQLLHELFLSCFAEKQNNVEAAVFTKKILRRGEGSAKSLFFGLGPGPICRSLVVGVCAMLKRFCSAGTLFFANRLLAPFSLRTGTPINYGCSRIFCHIFIYIQIHFCNSFLFLRK
jgi:hypothetical protein